MNIEQFIDEETWHELHDGMSTQEHYYKFTKIYMHHYESSYLQLNRS